MVHNLVIRDDNFLGVEHLQRKIITEIIKLRNLYFAKNDFFFESIYVSTAMINIISDSSAFSPNVYDDSLYMDDERPVGIMANMQVYTDHSLRRNQIKLSINKGKSRDIKIKTILGDIEGGKVFEIIIEVDSDLI